MKYIFVPVFLSVSLLGAGCAGSRFTSEINNFAESGSLSTKMDFSGTGLDKVESNILDRTDLTELDVSNNSLTDALPSQLGQLKNLRVLDASDNQMTGVPAEIGQLSKLEVLDLSNNLLTGLPNELGNLKNLKTLDLRGNRIAEQDLAGIRNRLADTTILE